MRIVINVTKSIVPRLILFGVFFILLLGVIAYARGYRFNFQEGTVTSTGIISVNSTPNSAQVYVNGELRGVTDINLTLPYGDYTIEVKKNGFTDWKKQVNLKGEIVMNLDAHLFSKNTSLTPLTTLGIVKAIPVRNSDSIILFSQTGDIEKDGLYLFESTNNPISIFPPLKLLLLKSRLPPEIDLSAGDIEFSPDYTEAILTFQKIDETEVAYLLSLQEENTELFDLTGTKESLLSIWDEEKNREVYKIIEALPKKIVPIATESFEVISLSPNEKRLMYRAKKDATLPLIIDPPLIGANQTKEERTIKAGSIYIYDRKEDKNFRIPVELEIQEVETPAEERPISPTPSISPLPRLPIVWNRDVINQVEEKIQWYPTSDYIAVKEDNHISVMQYDGGNKQTVYAGPFTKDFFSISPDWNLLVLINLNPQLNPYGDLYAVGIR